MSNEQRKHDKRLDEMEADYVRAYLATIGAKGGSSKSPAKVAAAKRNGNRPCAPGKRRGRKVHSKEQVSPISKN